VNTISKTSEGNFTQFWSQMYRLIGLLREVISSKR